MAAAARLRSFRVYPHKLVAVYREAMTRRDCDSLSGTRSIALRAVPANEERSRRDKTTSQVKENAP
jgi:hypothetical protein